MCPVPVVDDFGTGHTCTRGWAGAGNSIHGTYACEYRLQEVGIEPCGAGFPACVIQGSEKAQAGKPASHKLRISPARPNACPKIVNSFGAISYLPRFECGDVS